MNIHQDAPEVVNQQKKRATDPDFEDLNPDIIQLAHTNGFVRSAVIQYLTGQLTWTEALETMVLSIHKEFKLQQTILNHTITNENVPHELLLAYCRKTHQAIPALPSSSDGGYPASDGPSLQSGGN